MSNNSTQLSNPFSTGGGGGHFEAHVQASFVALMLTGGYAPCLPCLPIKKIQLQGKFAGYNTDDVIVFVENTDTGKQGRLLGQIKHSLKITEKSSTFGEVIKAAWEDFNKPEVFIKGRDIFALITGPLTAIDTNDTRSVLEWARYSDNADEFFNKVELTTFSSNGKRKKLEAFKTNIKKANNGNDVENKTIHAFLKHFHLLGFDLDIKSGVTLALMHSLIGQYSKDNAASIWTQLVDEVQSANKNGGTITPEKLPEDLKKAFKQPALVHIPTELTVPPSETAPTDWSQHKYATALALANLVGAWNKKNPADISILNQITTESYSTWVGKIGEVIQLSDSPISLQNEIWKIEERISLWTALGSRIFDEDLDTFKELIVAILTERDPSFELPKEERYMASIDKKVLTYSQSLRKGLAESLALLGTRGKDLIHCSQDKAENTAVRAIHEILADADWVLWGSLNTLLPILAEAAPDQFLNAVEKALNSSPCPFDELFSQEGDGITGGNYLTGLLYALEGLAWHEEYLVRVCVVLGELASHDPGGNWANRPANSLSTILLPWLPQTIAPIEKRQVAVKTLRKELPDMAWKLIIKLLPNQQTSTVLSKPSWRNPIPEDWKEGVTQQEYWEQVSFYAELAVSMASEDNSRLRELIDHFHPLPKPSFERLLEVLSSNAIIGLSEDERLPLWDKLTKFISKHRRFSNEKWALNSDLLSDIEAVSDKLAPSKPLNLYQHLFSNHDYDLYEENENVEEQSKKLDERRKKAISEILKIGGINSVIELAEAVNLSRKVGYSLGCIADAVMDKVLLPAYLETENKKLLDFVSGYIWIRRYTNGWSWADTLDKSEWSTGEIARFLGCLPFTKETWDRTVQWLGESQGEYWAKTDANIHQTDGDLSIAIDKFIEHGRPHAAINCLTSRMRYAKQPIDIAQSVKALLKAVSSSEPPNSINPYPTIELIKALQENPEVNPEDLFRVEWAYLPWLDGKNRPIPKMLERRLAGNPDFFCEVIQLIYRSKKGDKIADEPSEYTKAMVTSAWELLHKWRTPPGMQSDGSFKDDEFDRWLQRVKEVCTKSGHLEVALNHLGQVLIYCPADADGLWIHHRVADALNSKDSEKMRQGYQNGLVNSREVYWVDPTGKSERELAEKYRTMAHEVENAGYQRFAVALRSLSKYYDREAEHIVRYKGDD